VSTGIGSRNSALQWCNGYGIYNEKVSAPKKKKFKGFPMFLHSKNFKTAFMGDIKQ
jgi:hypothetical protein